MVDRNKVQEVLPRSRCPQHVAEVAFVIDSFDRSGMFEDVIAECLAGGCFWYLLWALSSAPIRRLFSDDWSQESPLPNGTKAPIRSFESTAPVTQV